MKVGLGALVLAGAAAAAQGQSGPSESTVPVTVDNFPRAESDMFFGMFVRRSGIGQFYHHREPPPLDAGGARPNRDTLYSEAVFDLDAGPVTITLPEAAGRYMVLQIVDEDHYAQDAIYAAGDHTFTREGIGTRSILAAVRTLVDPADPQDVAAVHALQDAIRFQQPGGPGRFEVPPWDEASRKTVRDALLALNATLPDLRRAFGQRGQVDPVRHLIGTASGWGGNPDRDAIYLTRTPARNDGSGAYRLTVRDVPVDRFWSISVYDAQGHFAENPFDAYTLNNLTARGEPDGSVTIQFGGCDGRTANCLPIVPGWNYMVRLYRPRPEILNGTWQFPEAQLPNLPLRAASTAQRSDQALAPGSAASRRTAEPTSNRVA